MFRQLVQSYQRDLAQDVPVNITLDPNLTLAERNQLALVSMHPFPLSRLMEWGWLQHELTTSGETNNLALPEQLLWNFGTWSPGTAAGSGIDRRINPDNPDLLALAQGATCWDHLIYAYFVENTRAIEIFRRIVREYAIGERLPVPINAQAVAWIRAAEELFFRDATPFPIANLISQIRPDFNATRRNAYFRMFGMDLNHGADDGRPYAYEKAEVSNRDFVRLFEQLLVDVWAARVNRNNEVGANPTDPAAVARTVRLIAEMLTMRRRAGMLQREEFVTVSMASWFHLTITMNTPIVQTLNATATTAGERLIRLGQRVGIAAHPRTREFLELANNMSILLRLIESGVLSTVDNVELLWHEDSDLSPIVDEIITSWSLVTGRDIKAQATRLTTMPQAVSAPAMAPALAPAMAPALAASNNGAVMRS